MYNLHTIGDETWSTEDVFFFKLLFFSASPLGQFKVCLKGYQLQTFLYMRPSLSPDSVICGPMHTHQLCFYSYHWHQVSKSLPLTELYKQTSLYKDKQAASVLDQHSQNIKRRKLILYSVLLKEETCLLVTTGKNKNEGNGHGGSADMGLALIHGLYPQEGMPGTYPP